MTASTVGTPPILTVAHENRDFVEWHGGVSHYAFWAIDVPCPHWKRLFDAARRHVAPWVHAGYRRAPHVTVAAAGLMHAAGACAGRLERQQRAIEGAGVRPFLLQAGALESFSASPYIAVIDPEGALARLRAALHDAAPEDCPPSYRPHLTVGLYRAAFDFAHVCRSLAEFTHHPTPPLHVDAVYLCAYETGDIQGACTLLKRVPLPPRG